MITKRAPGKPWRAFSFHHPDREPPSAEYKHMAARLNPQQDERSRSAIKTTQLVKRLNLFALNELDDAGNVVELDAARLRAIEILLRKTLPDLSNIQVSGDADNPLEVITRIELVSGGDGKD